jgi:hypothetical protein
MAQHVTEVKWTGQPSAYIYLNYDDPPSEPRIQTWRVLNNNSHAVTVHVRNECTGDDFWHIQPPQSDSGTQNVPANKRINFDDECWGMSPSWVR